MKDAFERRRFVPTNFRGRISVNTYDPGFENYRNIRHGGRKITVSLDGVEQPLWQMADTETGELSRHRMVKDAIVVQYGIAQVEQLTGEVAIRLGDKP